MAVQLTSEIDHPIEDDDLSEKDKALYHRGLHYLQAGEWKAAIEYLSELARRHPDRQDYAKMLEQARLKAKVAGEPPRRVTTQSVLRSRRIWTLVVLNFVLWLGVAGRQLYVHQIKPAIEQRHTVEQQRQLVEQGTQALMAGDLDLAERRLKEALDLGIDNATARSALEEINKRRQLTETYDQAMHLIEQEDWDAALAALETIRQTDPGFRDVQTQIKRVNKARERAAALQQASELLESGDLQRATEQLLLLQEEMPDFKPETVKKLLVESYTKQAEAALSDLMAGTSKDIEQLQEAIGSLSDVVRGTTSDIEQLQQALRFFAKALEVDPSDVQAATEAQLAQEYLAGIEAYRDGNWELASIHLANIYPSAPAYATGRAAILLQAAYVQNGNRYRRRGEYERAAEKYRQAIAVGLAGNATPVPDEAAPLLQAADDLVLEGLYREAAAIYGQILQMMGYQGASIENDMPKEDEVAWQRPPAQPANAETGVIQVASTENDMLSPSGTEPTSPPIELYVVRPNDTLSRIAAQFNTSVAKLVAANDLIQNPNLIRPGWRLLIPQS